MIKNGKKHFIFSLTINESNLTVARARGISTNKKTVTTTMSITVVELASRPLPRPRVAFRASMQMLRLETFGSEVT